MHVNTNWFRALDGRLSFFDHFLDNRLVVVISSNKREDSCHLVQLLITLDLDVAVSLGEVVELLNLFLRWVLRAAFSEDVVVDSDVFRTFLVKERRKKVNIIAMI